MDSSQNKEEPMKTIYQYNIDRGIEHLPEPKS
jgi:hypothetical protein